MFLLFMAMAVIGGWFFVMPFVLGFGAWLMFTVIALLLMLVMSWRA